MNSETSSGVVGGAKLRVASGSVHSSKCERPATSTKRRTYFSGMIIAESYFVWDSVAHEPLVHCASRIARSKPSAWWSPLRSAIPTQHSAAKSESACDSAQHSWHKPNAKNSPAEFRQSQSDMRNQYVLAQRFHALQGRPPCALLSPIGPLNALSARLYQ